MVKELQYLGYFYEVLSEDGFFGAKIFDPFSENITKLEPYKTFQDANFAAQNFILSCVIDSEIIALAAY